MAKTPTKNVKKRKIDFSLPAAAASEVILMGDFNKWSLKKHQMKQSGNGVWQKTLFLKPGTYEYKFRVDGKWLNDPGNALTCPNNFGTRNSFVVIPEE